jgi:hypothetical protein
MEVDPMSAPAARTGLVPARLLAALAACLLVLGGAAAAQQPSKAPAAERDPQAIEALQAMGSYLRSLKRFSVRADTLTDEVLTSGQKLQFAGTVDYLVQAPDRMRADVRNDRRQRIFIYDGNSVTLYAPRMQYYGTVAAPGTIREALPAIAQKYDLDVPLADLFLWGTDKGGLDDIRQAAVIGPATIAGKACTHYAFRQDDVDWQLWIQQGRQPLPCKIVITTTAEPSQPQYAAVLTWNLAPKVDKSSFAFSPPKGVRRIDVAPVAAKQ